MSVTQPSPIQQLEQVLDRYQKAKGGGSDDLHAHPQAEQTEVYTSLAAAIERLAPPGTHYYTSFQDLKKDGLYYRDIPTLVGIAEALKTAYASGYLRKVEELIHADLFADFLAMGEYLLEEGYKDPAAVIIGGVLEEHLRKLCLKNSIDIIINNHFKKADTMNSDLARSNVYNRLDQKNITAWLDLRNKAAHGRYTEYTDDQVDVALLGIRDFIARFPA
jgi:hypothetical protein